MTGATGFLGGELARQLREGGHDLTVLARDVDAAAPLAERGCAVRSGDITDKESIRAAMAGADGVFHIAGWYKVGVRDTRPFQAVNVDGTRNVLEVMAELEIRRGVYTSTLATNSDTHGEIVDESYRFYGKHVSHYDRTKWEAHEKVARPLMEEGLPLVVVLPGLIYGLGDHSPIGDMIERCVRGRLPVIPPAAYCWGHVADVATAHRLAMDRGVPGEEYIVAGPPATLREAMNVVASIAGTRRPLVQLPAGLLRLISRSLDSVGRLVPSAVAPAEALRVAAGVTYLGDNAKARRQLGYQPRTIEEGLGEYIPALMQALGLTESAPGHLTS